MEPFDQVARRYLSLQGVLVRAVNEDDKPVIVSLIQRIQGLCDDTTTLLSEKKEELVREQRLALEETQAKLNTELEKLQDLQAREGNLKGAQAKLEREKEGLAERERAIEQGNQALNQGKDRFLADLEHRAKEETIRDKERSLAEQDLANKRNLLQRDLDQIKNDRAKIIEDQTKILEDQAKVTQMQQKVIEDQTTVIDNQTTLREKEQQFFEAQERAKEDNDNFKSQAEQQAYDTCERLRNELTQEEEAIKAQYEQQFANEIAEEKKKLDADYLDYYTKRIEREEESLDGNYQRRQRELENDHARRKQELEGELTQRNAELEDGHARRSAELEDAHARRSAELEDEYARRNEELEKEKQSTISARDSLQRSTRAIRHIDDSLDVLTAQRTGWSDVIEILISRQGQEGDLISSLHQAHDTVATYFRQLESATQSLSEEHEQHEATRAALTSASSNLTAAENHIISLQGEKAALEARLRTAEENLQQQAANIEEKRKENQKDKASLVALRSARLQDARRKRARDEADNGPTFWHQTMKDAKESLDLFYVAKSCSMKANDLVPRLWDILENGSMYKRLLGFHNNAQPCNWRCLRTLVTKGSFVAKPLTDAGCPFHPSEKCLQVRIMEEEEGGRVMDFRMA
ncbi:hypothetical protein CDV36_009008 [Fusarium kuroshium]|uniref:Uncharacterized protein n=1 Tax=Fusarium kuroshium TaxID=2010991 RepID=A0A3M2S1D2_9HYPO|nr:hypothetical protein CDV36_009008 [Fusarium kuroshium]